ncbi:MAG: DUF445 domain-containing protein [Clostridia bacterium]
MNYTYITAPAVGALIGYITNFIAIKMLFRPLTPKYIFGMKIPFTPGIIPREKARLAKSVGTAVGEKLLTDEIIIDTLLSPLFQQKIEEFIDQKILELENDDKKINDIFSYALDEQESEKILSTIENDAVNFLCQRINSPDVAEKLSSYISNSLENYMETQLNHPLIKMALSLNKSIVGNMKHSISNKIQELLFSNSRTTIESMVQDEMHHILDIEIKQITQQSQSKIHEIKKLAINVFINLVKKNIHSITVMIDIPGIVEKRISDFDVLEVEELILSIIDKELKAIIWLGALLGLIMGFLMPLLS